MLRALVQLPERGHPPLPAPDRGCGRGTQPLRQLQLVRAEGGAPGPAEPAEEPENTEVRAGGQACELRLSPVLPSRGLTRAPVISGVLNFSAAGAGTKGAGRAKSWSLPSVEFEISGKHFVTD